jgi:peptide/nickel transport system ATP-binding protein/oligopeptide transport system ATP-binding protein
MTLLEVANISKSYKHRAGIPPKLHTVDAVRDVSFSLSEGETLALIGETGAGKSTVARMVVRLIQPDSGRIAFEGIDVLGIGREDLRHLRAKMQMVFQDPYSSFDPRVHIGRSVAEPLLVHGRVPRREQDERVAELFARVGLSRRHMGRYPRELSGGQLQRAAIARALTTSPTLIICDEPVAALDVLVRAQTLNLLSDLQAERGIAYLFITHDLSVVRAFADSVTILQGGQIVERGTVDEVYSNPTADYTRQLLADVPKIRQR